MALAQDEILDISSYNVHTGVVGRLAKFVALRLQYSRPFSGPLRPKSKSLHLRALRAAAARTLTALMGRRRGVKLLTQSSRAKSSLSRLCVMGNYFSKVLCILTLYTLCVRGTYENDL